MVIYLTEEEEVKYLKHSNKKLVKERKSKQERNLKWQINKFWQIWTWNWKLSEIQRSFKYATDQ